MLSFSDAVVAVELHVLLDVDHRAIGAGDDRLAGSAGEPVDHRAAHDQAEDDFGLHDAELGHHVRRTMFSSSMMMPNTIVVAPTTAVPMSTGLAVALKVLPAPSPFSS